MRLGPLYGAGVCLLLLPIASDAQGRTNISVLIPRIGLRVNLPVDLPVNLPVGVPRRRVPADDPADVSLPASRSASRVVPTAEHYLGVPYVWGGESPREGFDCSGFTRYVFRRHGVELPRTSRQQATVGRGLPVSVRYLRPGDLIMFANSGERISHVAIYAGNYRIIHATSSGGAVRYDDLRTRRGQCFAQHMVVARRVVSNGHSLVRSLNAIDLIFDGSDRPDWAPRIRIN
jgi:cell wall-associated NlpC family hydrolase